MRATNKTRFVIAVLVISTFVGSSFAMADQVSDLQRLLFPVGDVTATGYGPTKIALSWVDRSPVESGFRIEVAVGDEHPDAFESLTMRAPPCNNGAAPSPSADGTLATPAKCMVTIDLKGKFGLVPADSRPLFFRVIPYLEVSGSPLLEGIPSEVDPALLGPLAPTEFRCNGGGPTACTNVTSVTLDWTDNSDEAAFWVMRARGSGKTDFGTKPHVILPANFTTFHEDLEDYGAVYTYKLTAVRARDIVRLDGTTGREDREEPTEFSYTDSAEVPTGATNESPPVTVIVPVAPVPAPADPSGLTAVFLFPGSDPKCPASVGGCTRLTWIDAAPLGSQYINEDGWFIEIGLSSDPDKAPVFQSQWTSAGTPGPGARTYYDTTMTPDTKRCYQVRAWRLGPAYSAYTNYVCLGSIPKAPSNLTATAISNAVVRLNWKDNSTMEEKFTIERRCDVGACVSQGTWETINNAIDPNTETAIDNTTSSLTKYSYRVRATNSTGPSSPSNIATVTTLPEPVPGPDATLVAEGRAHAIALTWRDKASNETAYRIEYQPAAKCSPLTPTEDWQKLVDLPANVQGYIDTDGLSINQSRNYRVRAVKGTGVSDPSNEACAKTLGKQLPDGRPVDVRATAPANTTIKNTAILLEWTDTSTNETAFEIHYAVSNNNHCGSATPPGLPFQFYKKVVPLNTKNQPFAQDATDTGRSWLIDGLTPHSAYYFRVRAVNPDGESAWGLRDGVSAPTPPATETPTDVVTTCVRTAGPPKPVLIDPSQNNQISATRCNFTVQAPRTEKDAQGNVIASHDRVGGMKIDVISTVPNSSIAHRDTLFVVANGGTVPGATADANKNQYVLTEANGGFAFDPGHDDYWRIAYLFRHGINYKLLVYSYLEASPHYSSRVAHVADFKVAADCPVANTNTP